MTAVHELFLNLSWNGDWVRVVLRDADGSSAGSEADPISLRARHVDTEDPRAVRHLGTVLMTAPVRRRVHDEVARLGVGQVLRLRLRTAPGGPLPLASFAWEKVQIPAERPDLQPEAWDSWVRKGYYLTPTLAPRYESLGSDRRFSLVREVDSDHVGAVWPVGSGNAVVVAGAASVYGNVTSHVRSCPVPPPPAGAKSDGDVESVRSALAGTRFEARTAPSPSGADDIRQQLSGGALAFYFGGHQVDGGLVVAERAGSAAASWLDGADLAAWLVRERVPLVVLMACDSATPVGGENRGAQPSLAEILARAGVPYVVAVHGRVSDAQAREFASRFFRALVERVDVDLATRRGAHAFDEDEARPVLYTSRVEPGLGLEVDPAAGGSALPSEAYRVPVHAWTGDGADWPDERFLVRLDAHLCLRERDFEEVLADPSGDDLADLLNGTEQMLWQGRRDDRSLSTREARRQWYTHEPDRNLPPLREEGLRLALSPAYLPGSPAGLVVRRSAGHPDDVDWAGYVGALRRSLPDLRGVVVQIVQGDREAADRSAQRVAARLGLAEHLVRAAAPEAAAGHEVPVRVLRRALDTLARRHVDALAQAALPRASADAVAVIRFLNDRGAPWGDPRMEAAVLQETRRAAPGAGRELLKAHAALRDAPARWASLCVTARSDADLADWLQAAQGVGRLPYPEEFAGLPMSGRFVDTVVLGLLRRRLHATPQFEAWLDEEPSTEVAAAAEVARRGPGGLVARDLERPDAAVALDRAGLLSGTDLTLLDPRGRRTGSWTLLMRRQLTRTQVDWLLGMLPRQRALVGLWPTTEVTVDYVEDEKLQEFRRALRPPLPRVLPGGAV